MKFARTSVVKKIGKDFHINREGPLNEIGEDFYIKLSRTFYIKLARTFYIKLARTFVLNRQELLFIKNWQGFI